MKITLSIPTSLEDITLRKYQEYEKLINTPLDDAEMILNKISVLCDVPVHDLDKVEINEIEEINNILNYTLNQKPEFRRRFTLHGVEFGFIPNLDKITFGEYVDLDAYIQDTSNMHRVMAVLFRPIIKKKGDLYDIAKYTGDENPDIMLDMPMDIVSASLVFFYTLGKELLKAIPNYLEKELKKEQKHTHQQRNSEKNGDGYQAYMHSLKEKFTELDKLLDSTLKNA